MTDLSLVIPCFREQGNLGALHERIVTVVEGMGVRAEVLLVDDGSDDGTWGEVEHLARIDSRVRGVRFSRNFGKEAAMLAGLRASTGAVVVIMDGDGQHPPELLPEMLEALKGGAHQVLARRTRDGDPWSRRVLGRAYYRLVNGIVDVRLEDGVGDFRLLSRTAVDALLSLPERTRFSKGLFSWIGFPTVTIDYRNVVRDQGTTQWTLGRLLNYAIDGAISFNRQPLRASIWLGLATVALTGIYLAWLLVMYLRDGVSVPGYLTLVGLVTGFGGVQLVCLGIIGEYLGRVFLESKARPHFVVLETIGTTGRAGRADAQGQGHVPIG